MMAVMVSQQGFVVVSPRFHIEYYHKTATFVQKMLSVLTFMLLIDVFIQSILLCLDTLIHMCVSWESNL